MQHTLCRGRATTEPLPAPPRRPQVNRLVLKVADKSQIGTIRAGHRPYGIGLLVAGADATGPHLFETQPSGQYFEYKAWAIGARSQAGRTYLEKHFEEFAALELDQLIVHALSALCACALLSCPPPSPRDGPPPPRTSPRPRRAAPRETRLGVHPPLPRPPRAHRRETLATGTELTSANAAVGFVSQDQTFTILEDDAIKAYVDGLKKEDAPAAAPAAGADAPSGDAPAAAAAPMDED